MNLYMPRFVFELTLYRERTDSYLSFKLESYNNISIQAYCLVEYEDWKIEKIEQLERVS